jgi:plastocyanin
MRLVRRDPTITGPSNANPSQFSPNCVHIKTGQMVTWNVDFTNHPLGASGGTTPSPIQTTSSGTMVSFTFGSTGTYGFHCLAHPSIMFGAVLVTQ